MTVISENTQPAHLSETHGVAVKPYEAPVLVELDVDETEAGGPGTTDITILS